MPSILLVAAVWMVVQPAGAIIIGDIGTKVHQIVQKAREQSKETLLPHQHPIDRLGPYSALTPSKVGRETVDEEIAYLSNGVYPVFSPKSALGKFGFRFMVYPLSRYQIRKDISAVEMRDQIREQRQSNAQSEWKVALREMVAQWEKIESKKKLRPSVIGLRRHSGNSPSADLIAMARSPSRLKMLYDALRNASLDTQGTDSTDLIEILVSLTNEKKRELFAWDGEGNWDLARSEANKERFCEALLTEWEISGRYGELLTALCRNYRDEKFDSEEDQAYKEQVQLLSEFSANPLANGQKLGPIVHILTQLNFAKLRRILHKNIMINLRIQNAEAEELDKLIGDQQHKHFLKLLISLMRDAQYGRPRMFAWLLREKLQKLDADPNHADSFGDISRILLSRAAIDLADINEEFMVVVGSNNDLLKQFSLRRDQTCEERSGGDNCAIFKAYTQIVEWALEKDQQWREKRKRN